MKVLLVDDEPRARRELTRLLRLHADVEIVGEAESVEAAVALWQTTPADTLFLDIQMPGQNGFALLTKITPQPAIIVCSAHPTYAVRAFGVEATDYLLKPVEPARLELALAKAKKAVSDRAASVQETTGLGKLTLTDRLLAAKSDGERGWVRLAEVQMLESLANGARLYLRDGSVRFLPHSLDTLEQQLDPQAFFRANRRCILQIDAVDRTRVQASQESPRTKQFTQVRSRHLPKLAPR